LQVFVGICASCPSQYKRHRTPQLQTTVHCTVTWRTDSIIPATIRILIMPQPFTPCSIQDSPCMCRRYLRMAPWSRGAAFSNSTFFSQTCRFKNNNDQDDSGHPPPFYVISTCPQYVPTLPPSFPTDPQSVRRQHCTAPHSASFATNTRRCDDTVMTWRHRATPTPSPQT